MTAPALYSQIAAALLLGAGVSILPLRRRRLIGILAAIASFFTLAPVLHGWMGPPSFSIAQLALLRLAAPQLVPWPGNRLAGWSLVLVLGFYLMSLGLGPFDPFDLGYRPRPLLPFIAAGGLWLAWRREWVLLTILSLDLFAFALRLFDNLWDCLFDPVLMLIVGIRLVLTMTRRRDRAVPHDDGQRPARREMRVLELDARTGSDEKARDVSRDTSGPMRDGLISRFGAQRLVLLLIVATAAVRILLASIEGLGIDESYWATMARTPSLSYVDDPPMTAWLTAMAAWIFGREDPVFLRLPFILLYAGSTWLMFRLAERLFGVRAGLWAAIAYNLAPIFTLGGMWLLPDGPLNFFLLATANLLYIPLFTSIAPSDARLYWIGSGVFAGLAFLSKYHAAFLLVSVLIFMVTVPAQRRWLFTPWPWLAASMAACVFAPVMIWNVQHGFAGLSFQADRISPYDIWPRSVLKMIGGATAFLGWLIIPLFVALIRALRRGPKTANSWFVALPAAGPIALFSVGALWIPNPFPHWMMPGWLLTFPLFGAAAQSFERIRPRLLTYGMTAWAVVLSLVVMALAAQSQNNWLSTMVPGLVRADPTLDLLDWSELRVAMIQRNLLGRPGIAVAATPLERGAGKIAYALLSRSARLLLVCGAAAIRVFQRSGAYHRRRRHYRRHTDDAAREAPRRRPAIHQCQTAQRR